MGCGALPTTLCGVCPCTCLSVTLLGGSGAYVASQQLCRRSSAWPSCLCPSSSPACASWGWLECSAWRQTLSAFAIGLVPERSAPFFSVLFFAFCHSVPIDSCTTAHGFSRYRPARPALPRYATAGDATACRRAPLGHVQHQITVGGSSRAATSRPGERYQHANTDTARSDACASRWCRVDGWSPL